MYAFKLLIHLQNDTLNLKH